MIFRHPRVPRALRLPCPCPLCVAAPGQPCVGLISQAERPQPHSQQAQAATPDPEPAPTSA